MLLGCIADDFTGATDLANTLTRRGMATIVVIGVPMTDAPKADAVVVALKSRTISAEQAVAQSLAACRWLVRDGARQIYFKYCSTFDSTDAGNIGPVSDALLDELGSHFTIACPAFPDNGRTVYQGHLFVGHELLSESPMRNHPLTPMRDSNLVRVLARQTKRGVGLVPYATVRLGPSAVVTAFDELRHAGTSYAIIDVLDDVDLETVGEAAARLKLVTGGSGAAIGLPQNFRDQRLLPEQPAISKLPEVGGLCVVLVGSCSAATLVQVEKTKKSRPGYAIDIAALASNPEEEIGRATAFARSHLASGPLISSAAPAAEVAATQARFGRDASGAMIENAMAEIARRLAATGVRRFVIAGGETSGAVVSALGIGALEIGPQIAPGVPVTISLGSPRYALALKSGNFGGPDFFNEALEALP